MSIKKFEILCIDNGGYCVATEINSIIIRLKHNNKLWKTVTIKNEDEIYDEKLKISCKISQIETNPDTVNSAIIVSTSGESKQLEEFRINIIKYFKNERFDSIYILDDDISKDFASTLYPEINSIENLLRKFLIQYFSTKLGPQWWDMIADSDKRKKVSQRKNVNSIFFETTKMDGKEEPLVDNKAYLIDFDDLGDLIYQTSAGNLTINDVIQKVEKCNTIDELKDLKDNLQKNIKKYFSEFEKIKFQEKWQTLKDTRNLVAHNSIIDRNTYDKALKSLSDLKKFLEEQNQIIRSIKVDPNEIDSLQENYEESSLLYKQIKKSELALELSKYCDWSKRCQRKFAGKKNFIVNILGGKGFDFNYSDSVLNELVNDGFVEIYDWIDPDDNYPKQEAIKIQKPLDELVKKE